MHPYVYIVIGSLFVLSFTLPQTSAANAAAAAANGLFLLSQAHQELTKREEAQARAGLSQDGENIGIEPSATNRRGSKRKIEEPPPPPPKPPAKKTRGGQNSRRKRDSTVSDDDDEDESMSPSTTGAPHPPLSQKSTKDMTDEEKRRNFLERNRQGRFPLHIPHMFSRPGTHANLVLVLV
jgi:ATF/CREB family transcription factor